MTFDFTNKSDREKLHELVKKTIDGHRNNIKLELTVNSLKCIERLIETQERLIEDQEERIAIMSEGGWVSVNDAMPDDYREVWVYTKGHIVDFGCHQNDYWLLNSFPSPENDRNVFVTHWQYKMIPKPPKEGEAE